MQALNNYINESTVTRAVKIGNLITEMHRILNKYYSNDKDRKKEMRKMVAKIYNDGFSEGYHEAKHDE